MLKLLGLLALMYLAWLLLVRPMLMSSSRPDRHKRADSPRERPSRGEKGGEYIDYEEVD